jgi:hypothetical protein
MTEATTAETSPRRLPWEPSSRRCANCEKLLRGPFCHDCGQPAHDFERSFWSLLGDAFHTLFNTDNRLFQTLPDLVVRPARLTRNFIAGHRQAQTPPFRLLLVCVLLAFFAGGFREFVQPAGPWYVADYRGEPALCPQVRARHRSRSPNGSIPAWPTPFLISVNLRWR